MASTNRGTRQDRDTASRAAVRTAYREHRIRQGDKWYNPVLDDPNHPDNPKHWTHGTPQGYFEAGCTACERCAAVGRAENERRAQTRIDKRLDTNRAQVARTLTEVFPDLDAEDITRGAGRVIDTHRIRSTFRAVIAYDPVPVQLALSKWHSDASRHVDDEILAEIAARLVVELSS